MESLRGLQHPALLAHQAPAVVLLALLVLPDRQVLQDQAVLRVPMDRMAPLVLRVQRVPPEQLAQPALLALVALQDQAVPPDRQALPAQQAR